MMTTKTLRREYAEALKLSLDRAMRRGDNDLDALVEEKFLAYDRALDELNAIPWPLTEEEVAAYQAATARFDVARREYHDAVVLWATQEGL